jgi:hypothetical protein
MKKQDIQLYVWLSEFVLKQAENQTDLTKMFLAAMDSSDKTVSLLAVLMRLPESDEKKQIVSQLAESMKIFDSESKRIRSVGRASLARDETSQERLEAALATLKASLDNLTDED